MIIYLVGGKVKPSKGGKMIDALTNDLSVYKRYMKYVPESKKEAIRDIWKDEDGVWITLNENWEASRMDRGCRTIHEDAVKQLRYQIAGIRKVQNG